ncbi:MAG: hypothetical protein ACKVP4_14585, partial [Hyphomicrobium sp.]
MRFVIDKCFHAKPFCESFNQAFAMRSDALQQIVCHAHVQCPVALTRHAVDELEQLTRNAHFDPSRPIFAEPWVPALAVKYGSAGMTTYGIRETCHPGRNVELFISCHP